LRGFLGQRARQFDAALAALAGRRGDFVHVPLDIADALDRTAMAVDGFHPGPPAYRDWARKLEVRIRADATLARWREGRPETRQ
jgi:lysophospholipase L1-like esterase